MTRRVGNRDGAALRNPKQRKLLYSGRLDNAFEVAYEGVERNVIELPIGQAVAARIVPDQPVLGSEDMQQVTPDRALPVIFEMIEPIGGFDQRRTPSCERIGNADSIGRGAEVNLLWRCLSDRSGVRVMSCRALFVDRANKAHAFARNGADYFLNVSVVANRFACGVDPACQRRIRYDAAAPDRRDQVVLAHHAVSVLDQVDQQVEHLRLQSNQLGASPKLSAICIKYMIFKEELHGSRLRGALPHAINQATLNDKSSLSESHFAAARLEHARERRA